jgi:hypothetical protein
MQISNEMTSLIRDVFSAEAEPILRSLSSLEEDDSPEPNQVIGAILILLKRHGPAQLDAIVSHSKAGRERLARPADGRWSCG